VAEPGGKGRAASRVAAVASLAALAGCGGVGERASSTATAPPGASAPLPRSPSAPPATGGGGQPVAPPAGTRPPGRRPAPRAQIPESTPGGAGDEQPIRVPASFTLAGGRFRPPEVSVPPFLAVQITVVSREPRFHRIVLETPHPRGFVVPPGGRVTLRLPGQRAGRYRLSAPGAGSATLAVGSEPGP